jgi:hypothetical protein
VNQFVLRSRM